MSKVVLSTVGGGTRDLRVDPYDTTQPARTPSGSELHLGSQDLVRLTGFALERGFVPTSFMISDAYLVALPEDEQVQVSTELLRLLVGYGPDEVMMSLQEEHDGLYIVGVNLIAGDSGGRISVRRRGFVDTSVVQEAQRLLASAWRELNLT
ncbi:hypothetical protein [Brachybacterium phenoliresistens]|uniref:hypothetical protein n=1 Tax=Brachybacterium phenoliresistens TaxID=396014 RepID=UPI0031E0926C